MKYKNYKNPYTKNGKIYSSSDIYNMKTGETFQRKKEIMAQNRSIGIPTDSELAQSDNVVWVNEYTRSDGTHVQGHWRSKPGYGQTNPINPTTSWNKSDDQNDKEDTLSESVETLAEESSTVFLDVLKDMLEYMEIEDVLMILKPIIEEIFKALLSEEDDGMEYDYSAENDEQVPWENAQPFKPDENPFLAEPEKQKGEKDDSLTGGASSLNDNEMSPSASLQEKLFRVEHPLIAEQFPEQEYYKISFALKNAQKTGKVADWVYDNNNVYKMENIKDKNVYNIVRNKVSIAAQSENDEETLNNLEKVYVIEPKETSKIVQILQQSPELKKTILDHCLEIDRGDYKENKSISLEFKYNDFRNNDKNKQFSTYNTIKKCDICDIQRLENGIYSMKILDYYDFAKSSIKYVDNAYRQQSNGHLKNYVLIIPVKIDLGSWFSKGTEIRSK